MKIKKEMYFKINEKRNLKLDMRLIENYEYSLVYTN